MKMNSIKCWRATPLLLTLTTWTSSIVCHCHAFSFLPPSALLPPPPQRREQQQQWHKTSSLLASSEWNEPGRDANTWKSIDDDKDHHDDQQQQDQDDEEDWQEMLAKRDDGSYWSEFEPSDASKQDDDDEQQNADGESSSSAVVMATTTTEEEETDAWLDTLASLSAEEVEFNIKEADRADKVRQMMEWGFEAETIANTLDVAMTDDLEKEEVQGMTTYRQESYLDDDDVDLTTVESHTRVEKDPETGEPIRQQMVYVDEHTWYGTMRCACGAV